MYAELTGNRKKQGIKSLCGNIIDVELGTGIYATGGSQAKKIPWSYMDEKGKWHTTYGMRSRPYMRPAIENHKDEYKEVLESEMSGS